MPSQFLKNRNRRISPKVFMDKKVGKCCLLDVHDILSDLQINFFLILGTALGAYRDRGFTPTEKDIDLGFLYEDFSSRFIEIAARLNHYKFDARLVSKPFRVCRVIVATRGEVKIDLVSYVLWKDKRFCSNSDPKTKAYSIVHRREMIEQYEEIQLFDRWFQVPCPIKDYLELEYGPDWKTPQQDHRSRTRVYGYRKSEGLSVEYLNTVTPHPT